MDYCKGCLSRDNKCEKRMACEFYVGAFRNVVTKEDTFFDPPISSKKECKKFKPTVQKIGQTTN